MVQTNTSVGYMTHSFQNYPVGNKPRSGFKRPNELLTSFDGGYLVPIWYREAQPGDTLDMSISAFVRMATQIVPFMTPVYMDIHVWCVPKRLDWIHWVNMMGEQKNPGDSIDYLTPQLTTPSGGVAFGSIYDYFGVRPGVAGITFNSWNFRAYNHVYNEWYRDENLQNSVAFTDADSGDSISDYTLLRRGKRKDYFTGALPWTQKGTAVNLPIGLEAPVIGNGMILGITNGASTPTYGGLSSNNGLLALESTGYGVDLPAYGGQTPGFMSGQCLGITTDPEKSGLIADLSQASGITVNQLYDSIAIQQVLQADALHGSRYIEMILGSFGVKSSDARLQRPEFLGGGHFTMDMQVIPQTASSDSTSPQGNLAANGTISGTTKRIVKSFEEHCTLFAVVNIRVPYYYQYGMDRDYFRHSRFDYYRPELANITEQAILNREIFVQGSSVVNSDGDPVDEEVFGYQEAWADMRYAQNKITGFMRSDCPSSLDIWHLGEKRSTVPALNDEWIQEDSTIYDRVLAVSKTEEDPYVHQFIGNFAFDEKWYRVMPVYSVPGIQMKGGL